MIPSSFFRFIASLTAVATLWGGEPITIDHPFGGWRNTQGEGNGFLQPVNYPASSVNTLGQSDSALIQGHITHHRKSKPATLIVNGIALPLSVDDDTGNFQRPYAFGAGSNTVEIRDASGKLRKQVQFYENNVDKAPSRLRIVLSWDSDGTDLDLHVVSPEGQHTFYGNRVVENGGALDVDVTTGYGPEIYANPTPPSGMYHVYVNYYGDGENQHDLTIAHIAIITQEGTLNEKHQLFTVPMRKTGELTLVSSFFYP
jgi:uncharacterized protein YfaP (DUF2135 family)